jgi:histidinol phosphate phosphatase hisN-like protein
VTRRPKSRLPRKLPDRARERAVPAPKEPSRRDRLKDAHLAGRSTRFSRDDVTAMTRALVRGDREARLGLPPFSGLTEEHVAAATALVFGWDGNGARARIDPNRTIEGVRSACARIVESAQGGGRIAFATARPASLLGVYRALAAAASASGARVLSATQSGPVDRAGRRLWWVDGVAVLSDGESLVAHDSKDAADELLFVLPEPDLVVADRMFAGTAVSQGHEVVAFADLDAIALAVAAWRGMSVRVVPIDDGRPPATYDPVLELLEEVSGRERGELPEE